MGRQRKLSLAQVAQAAVDRRGGMSWKRLSEKYKCAVNTVRFALSEYSDEFNPLRPIARSELEAELARTQLEVEKIKKSLRKRFNLHV